MSLAGFSAAEAMSRAWQGKVAAAQSQSQVESVAGRWPCPGEPRVSHVEAACSDQQSSDGSGTGTEIAS